MLWQNTSRWVLPQRETGEPPAEPQYVAEAAYECSVVDCTAEPFTDLVASWNAETPPGTALRVDARVRYGPVDSQPEAAVWTAWYGLGRWGRGGPAAEGLPRSAGQDGPGPDHPAVRLAIDTLRVADCYEATACQVRLTLYGGIGATPIVRRLAVSTAHRGRVVREPAQDPPLGRAVVLAVPARSQQVERAAIAGEICSPTSLGMVLHFYGIDQPTAQIAQAVFDHEAAIYGNWPFNVAYAGSWGLQAVVRYFASLGALERELQRGHPVIISIAFGPGEFPEAPIARSAGHLIVVTGVTAVGDFLVNDPAAHPQQGQAIARVYPRERLRAVFLGQSAVGYVIAPEAAPLQVTPAGRTPALESAS